MLKVGLVGCGFMGRMHASVYGMLEGVELAGCSDKSPERRAKFQEEFSIPGFDTIEELHASCGVDVIDVCVPTGSHRELAVRAAALGAHVVCEKPMALSLAEADEMIAACDKAGVRLFIGHCIRFWPEYVRLKELVDSGELGALLSINLTRYGGFPLWASDQWSAREEVSGGGVLDMHIHDMDYILYLLGEPDTMDAWGTVDAAGTSHAFTTMTYGRTIAHLEGGWNLPPKAPFKMAFRAVFEKGAAIWDAGPMAIHRPDREPEIPEFPKMEAAGGGNLSDLGGYAAELKEFTSCLIEGRESSVVTPQTSRMSLEYALKEIAQIKSRLS